MTAREALEAHVQHADVKQALLIAGVMGVSHIAETAAWEPVAGATTEEGKPDPVRDLRAWSVDEAAKADRMAATGRDVEAAVALASAGVFARMADVQEAHLAES